MVKAAIDPHVMLSDLSSDAARPFHPAPVIFHPLRGNLLGRISESERAAKISAVNVGVSCLLTAVNGSSRLKALASCGLGRNFFLGTGLAPGRWPACEIVKQETKEM